MTPEERADQVRRALVDCTNVPPGKATAYLAADLLPPGSVILFGGEYADLAEWQARHEVPEIVYAESREAAQALLDKSYLGKYVAVPSESENLAVRAARAEIERDAALERAKRSEEMVAALYGDEEKMLDTIRILGIPARDIRDIYETVAEWRKAGSPRTKGFGGVVGGTIVEPSEPRT